MAEIFYTFAVEEILQKLGSVAADGINRAWGLRGDLERLRDSTTRIRNLLRDAADRQSTDERMRPWFVKLEDLAYGADDVLDEFSYWTLRQQVKGKGKVRNLLSLSDNPVVFHLSMAKKVKKINDSLADVEKQATGELALRSVVATADRGVGQPRLLNRETDHLLDCSSQVVGRKGDVSRIIDWLVGLSNQRLAVVSIVGMAGIGKTTLAQLVYKEAKEKQLFHETMWICVSEIFDEKKILGGMLQTLDAHAGNMDYVATTIDHLRRNLQDKSFLLVLDDVWNEESTMWSSLKRRLEKICGTSGGNAILVTTRSGEVASIMETCTRYRLELAQLSDNECWSIIKEKVFRGGGEPKSIELEAIGKEIAKKCGGVPLAANVLGGTLHSIDDKEEWMSIRDSNVWESLNQSGGILALLKLSYDHLPSSLKPCFAYCSIFLKDHKFSKNILVALWMAEGLLDSACGSNKVMLIANSLFQDVERDWQGNIISFKMHDLVHDLALSVSRLETLIVKVPCPWSDEAIDMSRIRRLNLNCDSKPASMFPRIGAKRLRCLMSNVDVLNELNFTSLRSLMLRDTNVKELPASIGKLIYLRFLAILENCIQALPESITELYNLQTLVVEKCRSLEKLPRKMNDLVSLRHIYFDDWKHMPAKVGCLTNLRTLPFFVVGPEKGYQITELEGLNELSKKLSLLNLEHVRDKEEAMRVNLSEKMKISTLKFKWSDANVRQGFSWNDKDVLEGLQPPRTIECLVIENYTGRNFPPWMRFLALYKLVKLELMNCKECEEIPTLGHLPHLKIIKINRLNNVQRISNEFYGESCCGDSFSRELIDPLFLDLKEFYLSGMLSLEEWGAPVVGTTSVVVFPCLKTLKIECCDRLISIPISHLSSLVSLQIRSCKSLSCLADEFHGFTSLQEIRIEKCENLVSIPGVQSLTTLKRLEIYNCPKLITLPPGLQFCTSLQLLSVQFCKGLVQIAPDSRESPSLGSLGIESMSYFPPQLAELILESCWNLESFPNVQYLTSLKTLSIKWCPKLTALPGGLKFCTSLQLLYLRWCDGFVSIAADSEEFHGLTSLRELKIQECGNLAFINVQYLTALQTLEIDCCSKLTALPAGLKYCKSLQQLRINFCKGLISIPEDSRELPSSLVSLQITLCTSLSYIPDDILCNLTHLKRLTIGYFSEDLEEFPGLNSIQNLNEAALEELELRGWPTLKSIPHQLQHLTSLKSLQIWNFYGLEALPEWLGNLSSLQRLQIRRCGNLKYLPRAMQCLSNLKSLHIYGCPLLQKRCAKGSGPEWPNISHIQEIIIQNSTSGFDYT